MHFAESLGFGDAVVFFAREDMSCPYANSLGKPGEGVHAHFFGIAVFDVLATILAAYVLHRVTGTLSLVAWLAIAFAAGVAAHRFFCVRTTVDRALFG